LNDAETPPATDAPTEIICVLVRGMAWVSATSATNGGRSEQSGSADGKVRKTISNAMQPYFHE